METPKDLGKELPSIVDRAYTQHKLDLTRYREVKEIMSCEVVSTTPEATLEDAARVMGEKRIGSLIVVKYDTPVGMITERDLLSNVLGRGMDLREEKVERVMSYPLITICSTAQLKEAAQTMIKNKGRLAVFECGKLVGIVTTSDLIRALPEAIETVGKIYDFMTKQIITAEEKTPVSSIVKVMGEKRIGSVIITSKGEPKGIFTERDLLTKFLAKGKSLSTLVGEACSSPLITIPLETSVHMAAYTMASKHIRRLPIVMDDDLVGIVTARDLVEAYAK
jgi:CBS domain-containing protein